MTEIKSYKKMINIAIPYKGRGFEQVLDRFVEIGAVKKGTRNFLVEALAEDKRRIKQQRDGERESLSDVERRLHAVRSKYSLAYELKVERDYFRKGQPARILFNEMDAKVEGVPVRLVGRSHYEMPTALRNHEVQMAFVGWDELYADHVEHLERKDARQWSAMNGSLKEDSTDVRVLGSADLRDYVGHFMLFDETMGEKIRNVLTDEAGLPHAFDWEWEIDMGRGDCGPVYVDHKYQKIYQALLPNWTAEFRGSNDVERDVKRNKGAGIYVVQTGRTIKDKNLHIVGPLFFSETIIAVNSEDLNTNSNMRRLQRAFKPVRQDTLEAQTSNIFWHCDLLNTLGNNYHHCMDLGIGYVPGYISGKRELGGVA